MTTQGGLRHDAPRPEPVVLSRSEIRALAARLEAVREGRSQKALGDLLEISNATVSVILQRRASMTMSVALLDKIAAYFGMDHATLLRGGAAHANGGTLTQASRRST